MANTQSNNKLRFSLVSPERELFSGDVDQVVVPGADGQFGALALHAPTMSVVNMGVIKIIDGNSETKMFVGGGIVDVTPTGVAILAEDAVDLAKFDVEKARQELKDFQEDLRDAKSDEEKQSAQKSVVRLEALLSAAA